MANQTPDSDYPSRISGDGPVDAHTAGLILEAVAALQYGSVEVVIHDGKVVQIDKRERVRLGKNQVNPPRS